MIDIAPGVRAAVNWVELDSRISWVPAGTRGFEPASVYLVDCGGEVLLYDNGLPIHRQAVLAEVESALAGRRLNLWLSRMVEPDAIGNTMAVLDRLPVHRVLNSTHTNQLRMLSHRWPEFSPESGHSVERVPWNEPFPVGDRRFIAVAPAAKVIATSWLYDETGRTLFTSDFFGHLSCATRGESPVAETPEVDARSVAEHLLAKYEWLAHADTSPIRDRLAAIFQQHEVEVIAPGHGRIIRGRAAVDAHRAATVEALEMVSAGAGSPKEISPLQ